MIGNIFSAGLVIAYKHLANWPVRLSIRYYINFNSDHDLTVFCKWKMLPTKTNLKHPVFIPGVSRQDPQHIQMLDNLPVIIETEKFQYRRIPTRP